MMPRVDRNTVHETKTRVFFEPVEVEEILIHAAWERSQPGWSPTYLAARPDRISAEMTIEQKEEGSPPYRVKKWSARIDMTEDHRPVVAGPLDSAT